MSKLFHYIYNGTFLKILSTIGNNIVYDDEIIYLCHFCQLCPVILIVGTHYAGNHYLQDVNTKPT